MRKQVLLPPVVAVCLLAVGMVVLTGCGTSGQEASTPGESLHAKVLRTGRISCSYATYPPYCEKDPNSGEMRGIFVEVLEQAGQRLDLEIEWAEEVGWGTILEGLESGRHDAFGAGIWRNAVRSKQAYFSKPLFYNGIRVWVRSDDTRITSLADINSPDVRIAAQDGAIDDLIARTDFPQATVVTIPQLNPWSDCLLNIISGKADVALAEPNQINMFLDKNPGTLKELRVGRPLRVFATCYAFRAGEDEFGEMLDSAIDELVSDGTVERILRKYENAPDELLRVASPYVMPGPQ
jgi:ABC-type amino acid transport substrate-binding protein